MKEVLSFFTFGIGALCFVAFFTALKPLAVTATTGLTNPAYCSTKASPTLACPIARLCCSIVASRRAAIVTIAPQGSFAAETRRC
jgi:hypothetical protein